MDREFFITHARGLRGAAALAENLRTNKSGEPFEMEYRLIALDGGTVWVRDEAVLVRDEMGRPLYWQGGY